MIYSAVLFIAAVLATWRLTRMLHIETGPLLIFTRLRSIKALQKPINCVACLSVWVGGGVALLVMIDFTFPIYALAFSAITMLIGVSE